MDRVMRECTRAWHRLGVPREAAGDMATELKADLALAAADGVDPMTFVGDDPAGFAREWAVARGLVRGRLRLIRVCLASVAGAVPGGLAGLFVAYGPSSTAFSQLFQRQSTTYTLTYTLSDGGDLSVPPWLLLVLYVVSGLLSYLGALAAVSAALRWVDDPERGPTIRRLRIALPLGGLAGVGAAIGYGSTTSFSTDWPHPQVEALLALLGVILAAASSRKRRSGSASTAWAASAQTG